MKYTYFTKTATPKNQKNDRNSIKKPPSKSDGGFYHFSLYLNQPISRFSAAKERLNHPLLAVYAQTQPEVVHHLHLSSQLA